MINPLPLVKYFKYTIPDNHPAVYHYIKVNKKSAVNNLFKNCKPVFEGLYSEEMIREFAKQHLNEKKKRYEYGNLLDSELHQPSPPIWWSAFHGF